MLHNLHITRRRHRFIVAGGIVCCGIITICWPEHYHIQALSGTTINLFWLFMEPEV